MRIHISSSSHVAFPMQLLHFLPFLTLILALPAPVSSSSLPGIGVDTHLTPTTFTSTVKEGLWFIEHYSPWCGHCKHFKPTWKTLVDEAGKGVWEDVGGDEANGKHGDKESGDDLKEVRMGSVDCSVHGDLCDANNIKGYPTLLLFHNGQQIDTFKGPRELADLKKFLSNHVRAARRANAEEEEKRRKEQEKEKERKVKEATELMKAENAKANISNNGNNNEVNPNGEVLSLTASSFSSLFSSSSPSSPPTFVKFFAPWCGHCKKLAPTWRLLAKHMQGKVVIAEVDCDNKGNGNKALCETEGVEGYPTLIWYPAGVSSVGEGKGRKGVVYEQGRKLEQLKAFAEKASAAGVQPIKDEQELDKYVKEQEVVYLLLHSEGDTEIVNQIRSAASPLLGSPLILSSSSPSLFSRYSLEPSPSASSHKPWAILALKDHDNVFPSSIFHGRPFSAGNGKERNMEEAREWMLTHRLPIASELTRDTFQGVMNAPQKPLVVLALSPSSSSSSSPSSSSDEDSQSQSSAREDKVLSRLRDLGHKWRTRNRKRVFGDRDASGDESVYGGREVIFAWMDSGRWGDWVGSMYGKGKDGGKGGKELELEDVRVVLADHANLVYYDTDSAGNTIRFTSSASIFAAVEDALRGKTAYKHSEGVVERLARYLNAKLQSLEHSVTSHPFRSFLILLGVLGGVFWMLTRFVGADSRGDGYEREREEWREVKGRSGRLD